MGSKNLHCSLLGFIMFIIIYYFSPICIAEKSSSPFCGETRIESPFLKNSDSPLNRMVLCKSQKPYFRTSIGLYPISSINYTTKLFTVSHPSSSSSHYISPSLLVAGFPLPPARNSLIVFNCYSKVLPLLLRKANVSFVNNGTHLIVDDLDELEASGRLEPKDLNCSNYYWAHKSRNGGEGLVKYEVGVRVSFDIPAHVPNLCDECQKPDGHCGVGLKCVCHPQECRDRIVGRSGSFSRFDLIFVPIFAFIIILMVSSWS